MNPYRWWVFKIAKGPLGRWMTIHGRRGWSTPVDRFLMRVSRGWFWTGAGTVPLDAGNAGN